MASTAIGMYQYTYGAGKTPNRVIAFHDKGAVISTCDPKGPVITKLPGDKIIVEGASTTEKTQAMIARRSGMYIEIPKDRQWAALSLDEQEAVMQELKSGGWRIEVTNDIGKDPRFERVVFLSIFNPK